ncbi:unnamed protein product [Amoebophrya sp. A120]|nr:unnamed protein product [Amoebophrya sp. A120]|eukprot:GSA120T00020937001.1
MDSTFAGIFNVKASVSCFHISFLPKSTKRKSLKQLLELIYGTETLVHTG